MQSLAAVKPSVHSVQRRSCQELFVLPTLCILWLILWWHLSGEWLINEQYNYGWFVPFFALYLFWLRRQDRPRQFQISNLESRILTAIAVFTLLLILPIRLFEIGNPDWRLVIWIHAASVVTLALLCIWSMGGRSWLRHFAFPVAFIFVAVPWVTPVENPIIQGLMRAVASVAAETMTLFGIPAQLEGNVIRLTSGLVAVNEACSGVRSLQTSLMIGLLFGELKRLSISRRIGLIVGAIAIALVANFLRAVFLVWIAAAKSISEVNRWHDLVGYMTTALVFVCILVLASLLSHGKAVRDQKTAGGAQVLAPSQSFSFSFILPTSYFIFAFCWLVVIEGGVQLWYRAHESNLVQSTRWSVRWPEAAANFHMRKIDNQIRAVLRFDEGQAAIWTSAATSQSALAPSKSDTTACLLYLFHWEPGRNSALLANLHRPDVCLPAVGWTQVADSGVRNYAVAESFALPFRHFEFRHTAGENREPEVAHVFYCLWEDRATNPSVTNSKLLVMAGNHSTWTRSERIRMVLEGRRNLGQQAMEFITLSREPVDSDEVEARFAQALPGLIKIEPAK